MPSDGNISLGQMRYKFEIVDPFMLKRLWLHNNAMYFSERDCPNEFIKIGSPGTNNRHVNFCTIGPFVRK
jgi:hypothetical protein